MGAGLDAEREGARRNRRLAGAAKKSPGDLEGSRGRMINVHDRQRTVELIKQTHEAGASRTKACRELGLSLRTYQRWTQANEVKQDGRPQAVHPEPANKLTRQEREHLLQICNQAAYQSRASSQIVPVLADRGGYMASRIELLPSLASSRAAASSRQGASPTTSDEATGLPGHRAKPGVELGHYLFGGYPGPFLPPVSGDGYL